MGFETHLSKVFLELDSHLLNEEYYLKKFNIDRFNTISKNIVRGNISRQIPIEIIPMEHSNLSKSQRNRLKAKRHKRINNTIGQLELNLSGPIFDISAHQQNRSDDYYRYLCMIIMEINTFYHNNVINRTLFQIEQQVCN